MKLTDPSPDMQKMYDTLYHEPSDLTSYSYSVGPLSRSRYKTVRVEEGSGPLQLSRYTPPTKKDSIKNQKTKSP